MCFGFVFAVPFRIRYVGSTSRLFSLCPYVGVEHQLRCFGFQSVATEELVPASSIGRIIRADTECADC